MFSKLTIGGRAIKVEHPEGTTLEMVGKKLVTAAKRPRTLELRAEAQRSGVPWGDLVKWATDKAGIQQCASCREAQVVMNQADQIGWAEAFRQVRKIKGW